MISAIPQLWRLLRTGATFERTGAMREILDAFGVRGIPRFALRALAWPFGVFGRSGDPTLPPVARACQAMGPAYVKFGQILSTRPDVVGDRITTQLRYLQDRLPPFPIEAAREIIAAELGERALLIEELGPPVAAASIAQVHPARWGPSGEKVAVKVLRPNVARQFRRDIGTFYFIARVVQGIVPGTERLKPHDVVAHFEGVVHTELDLRLEAAAASEYRDNARGEARIHVPEIYWEGTGRRMLTMEWVEGLPLDPAAIEAAGLDCREIGARVIRVFLRHALSDGYFHADMHQGNLRVRPEDGALILFDFGIMGRLDPVTRRHYAEILFGFLTRNYRRVAEVHFEAGYVPPDRDVEEFAQALRAIGEPIFGQDVSQISMARLLAYLFETTERFGMETRVELILLQRTMVVVEGVARSVDQHSNIWEAARPVVETWIRDNMGPRQIVRDVGQTVDILRRLGPRLPGLAQELVMLAEDARTRRAHPPPPPPPPARPRWPALLAGVMLGVAGFAAGLLLLG
ncbi:2-polyprenylphenol 6-hydroxylase [Paralimibaculum aggregatum]|uniref:2-polyprenylphenol 6-hydroxylase n=1 Tax=Paralimibaculum aggregatum TaxID=3036245 RepID=A0ABQ6LMN9_9RHOB|nr:AarF/UbiB family protein [Limibaculum sp. NKW23]GMG82957.1 2-polyprenylphenol 6-hydroxylase [Limibaculum sp. NKW23]